jgi:UDP-N-acetylglucosamine 3-dehydrogenase
MHWIPNDSPPPVRVAVIGAGAMGQHHVRVYGDLEGAELVAVADPRPGAGTAALHGREVRTYLDYREMLDREALDAVSVVVPTSEHCVVALDAIDRGLSLLIEKPIASDSCDGWDIIERAERAGVVLAVGHVERFNPAIIELQRQLARGALGKVFELKARRTGPFPARIKDVGVGIDLATHDLDLMLKLCDAPVDRVYAETRRNIHTLHEDTLLALLRFTDGTVGSLEANWLTPNKVRDLTILGQRGMFVVDYLRQELLFFENGTISDGWDHLSLLTGVSEGRMVRLVTGRWEPLEAELRSFIEAVQSKTSPVVTGRDGVQALMVVEAVLQSAATGMAVCPAHRETPALVLAGAV